MGADRIKSPVISFVNNMSIDKTVVAPSVTPVYDLTLAYDIDLFQLSVAVDSNTQANYSYQIVIDGIPINTYALSVNGSSTATSYLTFPQSTDTFDLVPVGTKLLVRKGSHIKVFAYNSNSATTNGSVSVAVVAEQLDTVGLF